MHGFSLVLICLYAVKYRYLNIIVLDNNAEETRLRLIKLFLVLFRFGKLLGFSALLFGSSYLVEP